MSLDNFLNSFKECAKLFKTYGNEKYMIGEEITQLQHALQSANIAEICYFI